MESRSRAPTSHRLPGNGAISGWAPRLQLVRGRRLLSLLPSFVSLQATNSPDPQTSNSEADKQKGWKKTTLSPSGWRETTDSEAFLIVHSGKIGHMGVPPYRLHQNRSDFFLAPRQAPADGRRPSEKRKGRMTRVTDDSLEVCGKHHKKRVNIFFFRSHALKLPSTQLLNPLSNIQPVFRVTGLRPAVLF
jgi:hypothetical protein